MAGATAIGNHKRNKPGKLIPTPFGARIVGLVLSPEGVRYRETVSIAGEGSGARGIRRGVDGLEV
jgi:hypothetical protein